MIYDVIIIGAGASGLFAAASFQEKIKGLILEKTSKAGSKLLMTGAGQCNLTHGGAAKDFIGHYGDHGSSIRSILYKYSNQAIINYFESNGVALFERADGKIFPQSLTAQDVLDLLLSKVGENGFHIVYDAPVISIKAESLYDVRTAAGHVYQTRNLIVASGGRSYPSTGSDGSIVDLMQNMGIDIVPQRPSLAPITVQEYPYAGLSGISFQNALITLYATPPHLNTHSSTESDAQIKHTDKRVSHAGKCENLADKRVDHVGKHVKHTDKCVDHAGKRVKLAENMGDLLFTHTNFSGPAILNISRWARPGNTLCINYLAGIARDHLENDIKSAIKGDHRQVATFLLDFLSKNHSHKSGSTPAVPKRFLEVLCVRAGLAADLKAAALSGVQVQTICAFLSQDSFSISGTGGFSSAMATAGGISLSEVNLKTLECKKYPRLYIIGEALDVDGDTGGYNLQFAFSSAYAAAATMHHNL